MNPLDITKERVLIFDGAMGTVLQTKGLTPDDFEGLDGCNEVLVRTRPRVIQGIHEAYLRAGADVVETDSFGANPIVLGEYGIADQTYDLARRAAEVAVEVARDMSTPDRPRFVCGSVGPGTKLPTLGHISYQDLRAAFVPQMEGLLDGGVDIVIIETSQDLLQVRAALAALRAASRARGRQVPVIVSLTIERNGTMLVGSDLATALAVLAPLEPDVIGLNCATGPDDMKPHVASLGRNGPELVSVLPNAGIPRNEGGELVYPMGPEAFARWIHGFVVEDRVPIVGGCCGTTPEHIERIVELVRDLPAPSRGPYRPEPSVASLYQAVTMRQDPPPLVVGERTNVTGSKAFRKTLLAGDLDGMIDVAREQERSGAHMLDVSVAYAGRDEVADLSALVPRLAREVRLPLVIDSTDPDAVAAALSAHPGRCVVNSINLEAGRERLDRLVEVGREHGAAYVVLAIDEQGMARTASRKVEVAERILRLCQEDHGLTLDDLVFDMLTFTVASGDEESRRAALETLEALETFQRLHPGAHTILGVSNVSYGLKPELRKALNGVFLSMAVERGLTMAIVNARQIVPLNRIDERVRDLCTRVLLDDRSHGDPLQALLELYEKGGVSLQEAAERRRALPPRERLARMVVEGASRGLTDTLDELLAQGVPALHVVDSILIPAMQEVGELFASGQMQLPFVLRSAEVMKAAVAHLEPMLESGARASRGKVVLATVQGDVHDIGKNLVDIILSNNGYEVINLGIKVPLDDMLLAVQEHGADALGMSGLLVKSTRVMRDNLEEMARRGLALPVLLGGAALNRRFVEQDLAAVYGDRVHYCRDAFDAIRVLDGLAGARETADSKMGPVILVSDRARRPASSPEGGGGGAGARPGEDEKKPGSEPAWGSPGPAEVPSPPFVGTKVIPHIPVAELWPLLDEKGLFSGRWRYRRGKRSREEHRELLDREVRPVLEALRPVAEELTDAAAVVGYLPCHRDGSDLVITPPSGAPVRLGLPVRRRAPEIGLAHYFREEPGADVVGLFVVTVGPRLQERIRELFDSDRYQDYLHLHGLSVELAEAAAEWVHRRMRTELGLMAREPGRRGLRYSPGYPACPDLALQTRLFELLEPERIRVTLTEGYQMVPEQSVSALVVHHPEARYFSV